MIHLLTPLHTHIDRGLGGTAQSFRDSANSLEGLLVLRPLGRELLPIHYLRRHAIELFLKSAIVIVHLKLEIPWGDEPLDGEPRALVNGDWKSFKRIHSVKDLWVYVRELFQQNHEKISKLGPRTDWSFSPEVDSWIEEIDKIDPRSTFFRYPEFKASAHENLKDRMSLKSDEDLKSILEKATKDDPKEFVLQIVNENPEEEVIYRLSEDPLAESAKALTACVEEFHGLHAALRGELCAGK